MGPKPWLPALLAALLLTASAGWAEPPSPIEADRNGSARPAAPEAAAGEPRPTEPLITPAEPASKPPLSTGTLAGSSSPLVQLPKGWQLSDQLLGLPDWMQLELTYTAEPMGNPLGGERHLAGWMGQTGLTLSLGPGLAQSSAQWREADHWQFNLNLNHYTGDPLYSLNIGALFPLQQIDYPTGALLSEASLSRSAGDGWLALRAGIVPLNPSFITAPVFDLYVHSAFNDTLNIALNGLPISPYGSLGGVLSVQPAPELSLRYGWFDLSSTARLAQWLGSPPPFPGIAQGSAQLLQLSWTPAALAPTPETAIQACRSPAGLVRRGRSCNQPLLVQNQLPGAFLNLGGFHTSARSSGMYGSATLRSGLPLGLDERVWVGGAWTGGDAGALSPSFVAGGLVVQGVIPSRPLDLLVMAAGRAGLRTGPFTAWDSPYEGMLELGYQLRLNGNLALQPTLQWILNPSAGPHPLPGILAAGLQLSASF